MALNINTNVGSLNAQRNLNSSSMVLSKALQRLSSGLRINSAADDAAGLAISTGLTSQIKGLNQAIRNASDGLSLLGTAEGGINEQTTILQRVRELAVQSASDTNSASNRTALNDELNSLVAELDRIAQTVQFNGLNLLDGSFSSKEVQVGAYSGASQRISVSISSSRAADIGAIYKTTATGAVTAAGLAQGALTITSNGNTVAVGATTSDGVSSTGATSSALAYANAINAVSSQTGVTAEAVTNRAVTGAQTAGTVAGDGTDYVKINGVSIGAVTTTSASSNELISAINAQATNTGVTASLDSANNVVLTAADGRNVDVAVGGTGATVSGLTSATTRGTVSLSSTSSFTLGGTTAPLNQSGTSAAVDTTNRISTIDISTKSKANTAIKVIDAAISNLNGRRAAIGAQTNRLNSVISNLSTASENASASNARILDADFAAETASMTRAQILQQAGVSVLAQANQAPQLALSLLR